MKYTLIAVGKTVKKYLIEAENEYEKRLKHYTKFEEVVIPELKNVANRSFEEIKMEEGKLILSKIKNEDRVVLLDENGKEFTSVQFSKKVEKWQLSGVKNVVFVIGGAYGFSSEVYQRANEKLSLSQMTFSHQMIRTFFKEQLYRAHTILKGEPYHHQ